MRAFKTPTVDFKTKLHVGREGSGRGHLSGLDGEYWDDQTCETAAKAFAADRDLTIVRPLGAGVDGVVFKTAEDSAVKVARTLPLHLREVEVYFRLMDNEVDFVEGFSVPRMLYADADFRAIEMSIVRPPYCLDFATVTLDAPPDWGDERAAAFDESLDEYFGPEADRVRSVIATFMSFGVYLTDPHPGNIRPA